MVRKISSNNKEQEERNRELYSNFFSVLKDEDQYIRFSFITGVTKFVKFSVFSGMNQPRDISLSPDYAEICGITNEEPIACFQPEIERMTEDNDITKEECLKKLSEMYDGYYFARKGAGVYNPFSLFNAFMDRHFDNYWYSTGTPSFLIHSRKFVLYSRTVYRWNRVQRSGIE